MITRAGLRAGRRCQQPLVARTRSEGFVHPGGGEAAVARRRDERVDHGAELARTGHERQVGPGGDGAHDGLGRGEPRAHGRHPTELVGHDETGEAQLVAQQRIRRGAQRRRQARLGEAGHVEVAHHDRGRSVVEELAVGHEVELLELGQRWRGGELLVGVAHGAPVAGEVLQRREDARPAQARGEGAGVGRDRRGVGAVGPVTDHPAAGRPGHVDHGREVDVDAERLHGLTLGGRQRLDVGGRQATPPATSRSASRRSGPPAAAPARLPRRRRPAVAPPPEPGAWRAGRRGTAGPPARG